MKQLPANVSSYASSPEFTEHSIPDSLLRLHRTKDNTWAKIIVLEGKLLYRILEDEPEQIVLSTDLYGVVEPKVPHQVEVVGAVRFYVEFYR